MIESRLDRGRGPVATVLVQKGTLQQGDIVVAGAEWGRVRAMLDDKGRALKDAGPSMPVEILGLAGVPVGRRAVRGGGERKPRPRDQPNSASASVRDKAAGVTTARARHAGRDAGPHPGRRAEGSRHPDQGRRAGQRRGDPGHRAEAGARGSEGARAACRRRPDHRKRRPARQGVERRDRRVQRARHQRRRASWRSATASISATTRSSTRSPTTSRSWSSGKVAPKAREKFLGYAEIRKVFDITKVGKVAGCMVTEGLVKRGAGVRLLRDNVVIHTGRAVAAQALQGRRARSGARLRMRAVVRQLQRSAAKATWSSATRPRWSRLDGEHGTPPAANPAAAAGGRGNPPRAGRRVLARRIARSGTRGHPDHCHRGAHQPRPEARRGARPRFVGRADHGDGSAHRAGFEARDSVRDRLAVGTSARSCPRCAARRRSCARRWRVRCG